jgi:psp operon transcriptional activator
MRSRPEDIMILADHFASRMTAEMERPYFPGFTQDAIDVLQAHDWPGNVRELRNVVERSVYRMADPEKRLGSIVLDPFASVHRPVSVAVTPAPSATIAPAVKPAAPPDAAEPLPDGGFETATRAYEARLLRQALENCRFNQAEAARRLGLSYYQFRHHLRVHGMLPGAAEKATA